MKTRKATKKDIPQMFEILKINSPKYPKKLAFQELNEMFSKSLIKPTYIVAENKKEILGFGGFIPSWIDNRVFNIFWVNTNPKYKNQGIGFKLMTDLINRIKKTRNINVKMILISTRIPLFYKKFGFKKVTSKYDRDYILMSRNI
jgi:N-acetylglutamate synthase-like GNAT family acetyltransferase|tara:strand:- start:54 stop:488 length:435 start_codon:yes stop_codon:yes gene_type:complete